nr:hypothetical protein [Tanacetum cinerariifolium]
MQKIIKEQVKEQVKVQVSKILPRIEQIVNKQLEAEVLTRSSNSSKTSYAVATDLSEMELKKILIEKMEGNKSIHRSNEQRNLYKALVEAYVSNKIILDTYEETITLKRRHDDDAAVATDLSEMELKKILIEKMEGNKSIHRSNEQRNLYKALVEAYVSNKIILDTYEETITLKRRHDDDADKDEQPSAGSDRGSKRRRKGKEPESVSDPHETTTRSAGRSTQGSQSRQTSASESAVAEEPIDDDKLYKFKEGDFKRLRIHDIKDMLLLLVQGKLTNLTVKERFAFNVSLRMFIRSSVIQRRVEDLQLGFIYQNKDKQNRLMRINELQKFNDGTLTDVHTALDDRLKVIQMQYLPQSIWRKSDKDRAAAMIQAINKRLKTRRIMRSLERFIRGRLYERDFRMLQRTI